MTSEIRTNTLTSRAGLSTVTLTDSGPMFSGITTFVDNSGFNLGTGSSIFSPATNTLTFGTNNTEKVRVNTNGITVTGRIDPAADNTHDLGTNSVRFRSVYAHTLYGNGSNLTGLSGVSIANQGNDRLITATGTTDALNAEENLTYNGNHLQFNTTANGHGVKLVSTGNFYNKLSMDSGATSADAFLNVIDFSWDGDKVADIVAISGSDTTNKDDGHLSFRTSPSQGSIEERLRITSGGQLLVGTSNLINTSPSKFQVASNDATGSAIFARFNASVYSSYLDFYKSRNNTLGSATVVNSNDHLGSIRFYGADGSNSGYTTAAEIYGSCDGGSSGSGDMPGRITFHTRPDGAGQSMKERLRITSAGTLNIGASSQTTHLLYLQSTGDAGIHIRADSDNSGENDNPYLSMSQDGSNNQELKIGQEGNAGQNFPLSLANSPFIHANHSAAYPLQLAHMDSMCVFISNRKNELGLNDYNGNTVAGMEIHHRGNDTAAALKFTGHNNTGTPGVETFTQLTHKGANAEFEIHHMGSRAMMIGSTRRIRVPGIVGVAGSGLQTVYVESDGNLCTTSSLREYKTNITTISDTSWLFKLNPVTFNWKKKTEVDGKNVWEDVADDNGIQYGLIAEEVEAVKKDFCSYDNNNKLTGVHYDRIIAPLIKVVQDLKSEIDNLQQENIALRARVTNLEGE